MQSAPLFLFQFEYVASIFRSSLHLSNSATARMSFAAAILCRAGVDAQRHSDGGILLADDDALKYPLLARRHTRRFDCTDRVARSACRPGSRGWRCSILC
jgi:hypothetical protein